MTLLALCQEHTVPQVGADSDGQVATHSDHRVVTQMADLVALCGASRGTVRRMLLELEQRGICKVITKTGRGSPILVILGHFLGENVATFFSPETGENSDACRSGVPPDPESGGHFTESVQGRVIQLFPDTPARADLDLLRSSDQISDPGSENLREDLTIVPDEKLNSFLPADEWPEGCRDADLDKPAVKRSMVDVVQIPERAWAAADYLRTQLLAANGAAVIGTKPWEPGWTWPAGKPAQRTGDGVRTGLRLTWALEFQHLQGKVLKGMKNATPSATDDDAWAEVSRSVHWAFHRQTSTGYVIESPGSLERKWDRVQGSRRRQKDDAQRDQQPRGADKRPDPQAAKKFERW